MRFQDDFYNVGNIVRTDRKSKTVYFVTGELTFKTAAEFEAFLKAVFENEKRTRPTWRAA